MDQERTMAQSAMEFMVTYGWAFIIIAVIVAFLFYYISLPKTIVPSTCTFSTQLLCSDISVGSENGLLIFTFNITNQGQFPLINPTAMVSLNGVNSSNVNCNQPILNPGGSTICQVQTAGNQSLGTLLQGGIYITAGNCGLVANYSSSKSCVGAPNVTLSGSYNGQAGPPTPLYIYCMGSGSSPYTQAYRGTVVSGQGITSWTQLTSYPIGLYDDGCAIYQGVIYCVGNGAFATNVFYAQILNTNSLIGQWMPTNSYPEPIEFAGCSAYNGYLYCIGFSPPPGSFSTPGNGVYFAPILPGGGVGTWQATTPNPIGYNGGNEGLEYTPCFIDQGHAFCIGSGPFTSSPTNSIYYAPVLPQGGLGNWSLSGNYPLTAFGDSPCVVSGAYVFCISDSRGGGSAYTTYSAPINASGIGSWTYEGMTPSLFYGCDVLGGYVYCFNPSSTFYYAPISANTIGSWVQSSTIPVPMMNTWCEPNTGLGGGWAGSGGPSAGTKE